jgi:hypothetical protein
MESPNAMSSSPHIGIVVRVSSVTIVSDLTKLKKRNLAFITLRRYFEPGFPETVREKTIHLGCNERQLLNTLLFGEA